MFGWTKREKNEKSQNSARAELGKLSLKDKGEKLSRLRKRYPNRISTGRYDFDDQLFDYELILLYILLSDDLAVEEADQIDSPVEVESPGVEEITSKEVAVEVEATEASVDTTGSSNSPTPVNSIPESIPESTPETTSSDSSGSDSYDSGGDSGGDCGGDCGGD